MFVPLFFPMFFHISSFFASIQLGPGSQNFNLILISVQCQIIPHCPWRVWRNSLSSPVLWAVESQGPCVWIPEIFFFKVTSGSQFYTTSSSPFTFHLLPLFTSLSLFFISAKLFSQGISEWGSKYCSWLKWREVYKIKEETTSSWESGIASIVFLLSFSPSLATSPPPTFIFSNLNFLFYFTTKFQLIFNENLSFHFCKFECHLFPGCWLGMRKTRLTSPRSFAALELISLSLFPIFYFSLEFSTALVITFLLFKSPALLRPAISLANVLPFYSVKKFETSHARFPAFSSSCIRMCQMFIFFFSWSRSFFDREASIFFFLLSLSSWAVVSLDLFECPKVNKLCHVT